MCVCSCNVCEFVTIHYLQLFMILSSTSKLISFSYVLESNNYINHNLVWKKKIDKIKMVVTDIM